MIDKSWLEDIKPILDPLKPSKVLARADELLHEKGWCQGALGIVEGEAVGATQFMPGADIAKVCTMGAIMLAVVELTGVAYPAKRDLKPLVLEEASPEQKMMVASYMNAIEVTEEVLRDRTRNAMAMVPYREIAISIANWNDLETRTLEQVHELLSEAKVLADLKERP